MDAKPTTAADTVTDVEPYPNAKKLINRCQEFLAEIQSRTPGHELEDYLNAEYGPGSPYYEDFCKYIRLGLQEGWCATTAVDGPRYRRSILALPSPDLHYFSITTVYMESDAEYQGRYHSHPYGEINCVVQTDVDDSGKSTAQLRGMRAWQGAGWTSPGPGTHHYPCVRGGSLVALFFLPAGRISLDVVPGAPQPHCI